MTVAYVLISTEIGAEASVLESLQSMSEVEEGYIIYGIYDIIAKLNVENEEKLKEVVTSIRRIEGVKSTLTILVLRGFKK
ncbi:MAG: Lrp/AsnC ligand binding domain-containing protein [Thermoproteales archaeon]|nr:Lrp/AsnC ligand binding domain-containing protein [Thermoproteales archaeon]